MRKLIAVVAAIAISLVWSAPCFAVTLVGEGFEMGGWHEADLWEIYTTLYGSYGPTWSPSNAAELGDLETEADEVWPALTGGVVAAARYAGTSSYLGYYTDLGVGSARTQLLDVAGAPGYPKVPDDTSWGYLDGSNSATLTVTDKFGFYLDPYFHPTHPELVGDVYFSERSLNPDSADNMLTYVTPVPNEFMVAWADTDVDFVDPGGHSEVDQDFNDVVLTLTAQPVPEPATLVLFAMGGIATAASRLRKRK